MCADGDESPPLLKEAPKMAMLAERECRSRRECRGNAAGMGTSRCPGSGFRPSPQPCLKGPGRAAPSDGCGEVPGPDKGVRGVLVLRKGIPDLRKREFRDSERWDERSLCPGNRARSVRGRGFMGWGDSEIGGKRVQELPVLKNWGWERQEWGSPVCRKTGGL